MTSKITAVSAATLLALSVTNASANSPLQPTFDTQLPEGKERVMLNLNPVKKTASKA